MFFPFPPFSNRFLLLFITLASLLILITTLVMENFFEVPICRMCILERYPYIAAILIGTLLYFFSKNHFFYLGLKWLLLIIFLISFSLSFYHVGLEHEWFSLPSFCQEEHLKLDTVDALREHIVKQKAVIPCNVIPLKIFFLSLAEWNAITSFFLLITSWILLKKK